jgi:sentrin-specific protease 1
MAFQQTKMAPAPTESHPVVPPILPPEAEIEVDSIRKKKGSVSSFKGIVVSETDIKRLEPGNWLNDELINFYGSLVQSRADREGALKIHYFNSYFWDNLNKKGYEGANLANWTKKVGLR